jgi:cell division inhibitor SepF
MGFKDTWRRSLEYFGLVEGDYIEEGEYVEGDTGQEMALDETAVAPREAGPVRTLPARGGEDDADDIFGEDEPRPRRGGGRLRSVEPPGRRSRSRAPRPEPAMGGGNGGSVQDFSMHVVTPRSFNDAQQVADEFKRSKPVIINLQNSDRELSKRLIDFASGMTYALGGGMQRISQGIFLLTPANVDVSAEEKARILERGFFNQS